MRLLAAAACTLLTANALAATPDDFRKFGDATLGEPLAALDALVPGPAAPDATTPWVRDPGPGTLPEGVQATDLSYTTFRGKVLRISVVAAGDEGAALGRWATAQFGPGTPEGDAVTWRGTVVKVTFESVANVPGFDTLHAGLPARLTVEDVPLAEQAQREYRDAEQRASEAWKSPLTGADARLDPRVAKALDSAASKYGWASALKLAGIAGIMAGAASAAISKGEGDTAALVIPIGMGAVFLGIGAVLGVSAGNEIKAVTAPR